MPSKLAEFTRELDILQRGYTREAAALALYHFGPRSLHFLARRKAVRGMVADVGLHWTNALMEMQRPPARRRR